MNQKEWPGGEEIKFRDKYCVFYKERFLFFFFFLEKAMATHSSTLAWKIPWMEEPGRLQSMGSRRVGHDRATSLSLFIFMHWRGNGNPLQYSCLENPRDRGAWWAAVYGVAQSRTRLMWLSSSSSLFFNWRIIALQCCDGFCHTTTQVSHNYMHIPSLLSLPPTPPHLTPLGHHTAPSWAPWFIEQLPTSSLFHTW